MSTTRVTTAPRSRLGRLKRVWELKEHYLRLQSEVVAEIAATPFAAIERGRYQEYAELAEKIADLESVIASLRRLPQRSRATTA